MTGSLENVWPFISYVRAFIFDFRVVVCNPMAMQERKNRVLFTHSMQRTKPVRIAKLLSVRPIA